MRLTSFVIFLFFSQITMAQQYTWSGVISELIYENCSSCHHEGGIAPFNLMSYEDAVANSEEIEHQVSEREMPPWPANPEYMHFANESYLEETEIEAIQWWIQNDMPLGDEDQVPSAPVFEENGSLLETIDFSIEIDEYTLQSNTDEFRWFAFENPFDEDIYIHKLEVLAGNQNVVHHADLYYDTSGNTMNLDNQDPLSGFNGSTGFPSLSYYINAWQPGGNIVEYPENWGFKVPAGADFVVEIHYAPDHIGEIDQTKMNLQFLINPAEPRELAASWLMGHSAPTLIDGPLFIPANETRTFHQVTAPIENDLSVVSICPHMHFIGSSYKVWYTDPDGVDHPLIDIPRWDLHWQKYYVFQTVKHIPAGSVLKSIGFYDNTLENHDNPFNPPQDVALGAGTYDEMFLCYFIYSEYQEGDEHIIMDEDLITSVEYNDLTLEVPNPGELTIFPNPTSEFLHVYAEGVIPHSLKIEITDLAGNLMPLKESYEWSNSGNLKFDVSSLSSGIYILNSISNGYVSRNKFIKI